MKLKQARRSLKKATTRARDFAINTASTAEWLADFVSTTIRAESRHFAALAVETAAEKLTGFRQPDKALRTSKGDALEPLAGVRLMEDPIERLQA